MKLTNRSLLSRPALLAPAPAVVAACVAALAVAAAAPPARADAPTPAEESALGLQLRRDFLARHATLPDGHPDVELARRPGARVAAVSERPDLPYAFHVLDGAWDDAARQAISLPGGTIAVTRELLRALGDDEDRIAFALAHEVAHVALRHHLCAEGAVRPDSRALSLAHELEADRYGALYAVRAGYRFGAAAEALQRLATAADADGADRHPAWARRLRALDDLRPVLERSVDAFRIGVEALEAGDAERATDALGIFVLQFPHAVEGRVDLGAAWLVAARAGGAGAGGLEEPLPIVATTSVAIRGAGAAEALRRAEAEFRAALALAPADARARIGLALVEFRAGRVAAGEAWLDRAAVTAERAPELLLARGIGRYLADDPAQAAALFAEAREARPGWPAAAKNLALAFEALGDERRAAELWRELTRDPRLADEARWQIAVLASGS